MVRNKFKTFNNDDDNDNIQQYTKLKFKQAIPIINELMNGSIDVNTVEPYILHNIKNVLGEYDEKIIANNFSGKLYLPQQTLLAGMLKLEENNSIYFPSKKNFLQFDSCFSGTPIVDDGKYLRLGKTFHDSSIKNNIIITNNKVIPEINDNVKKYTHLTFGKIVTASDLTKINILNLPDILCIKDGEITLNGTKKSALEHLNDLTQDLIFARCILDDYDMLKINRNISLPKSITTWLISSTNNDLASAHHLFLYFKM